MKDNTISTDTYFIVMFLIVLVSIWVMHVSYPFYEIITIQTRFVQMKLVSYVYTDKDFPLYAKASKYVSTVKINRLNRELLRNIIDKVPVSIKALNFVYITIMCYILIKLFQKTIKDKKMLFLNPVIKPPPQGIEGFIKMIKGFVDDNIIEKIKNNPTPDVLYDVFTLVRKKTNMPPNWVARCFPKNSEERLRLLEWGKPLYIDRTKYNQIDTKDKGEKKHD